MSISGMSESNDSNPDWVRILCLDVLRCARSVEPQESRDRRDERIARRSTLSVRKHVYLGHVIERETDSGKSDTFFQCGNVVLFVLKLIIVAIRLVVFAGSARAKSLPNIIRVRLCAVQVALVVEKMSQERKVV